MNNINNINEVEEVVVANEETEWEVNLEMFHKIDLALRLAGLNWDLTPEAF